MLSILKRAEAQLATGRHHNLHELFSGEDGTDLVCGAIRGQGISNAVEGHQWVVSPGLILRIRYVAFGTDIGPLQVEVTLWPSGRRVIVDGHGEAGVRHARKMRG
eukprot:2564472-Rhodomonas_salina.2